ncbi:SMP-30/gluconolactonase/LRE family protein [Roseobacter sp. HKCCA0434]|uniref:SMP-30/gluconolactonase/LRE family protein n=1 Tax=Roseobacter sp. HKCCA0434 TaxID=3079297 RepID=UPI002905D583|nr:SMP-30/gluconolactonase/LRE family protein [Roseobacter sp. HKCCA0434]
MAEVWDDRPCELGEGPLWHPERGELFWFDILGRKLMSKARVWEFDHNVSAAGWIDRDTLLVAGDGALSTFDIATGAREEVVALEADDPATRSNDGRADPQGGFWIGTMGRTAEPGLGSIYRYYRGELRKLFDRITISNSICFAPEGDRAFFADTAAETIWQVPLDRHGWPVEGRQVFVEGAEGCDGAVCDAEGHVWSARWGPGQVVRLTPDGRVDHVETLPVPQVSCPALTPDGTLYATTAREGMGRDALAAAPMSGAVFKVLEGLAGRAEQRVIL